MGEKRVSATLRGVRRLVVARQHLAGRAPKNGTKEDLVQVLRDQAFVQWDPVAVVAPSHLVSIWSRIGAFSAQNLDAMLWTERRLMLHWTPLASIVLAEDFPIYHSLMKRYPESLTSSWGAQRDRARRFLADNRKLRRGVLLDLEGGPLTAGEFRGYVKRGRGADGWTTENEVSKMLFHLSMKGEVMVVGHRGNQNLWGLTESYLPRWVDREALDESEMEARAAERAIRGMGTATPSEVHFYFVRGRYQNLGRALQELEERSVIARVDVQGMKEREPRFVHREDIPLLESVEGDGWEPRVTLISPFDNLICGRRRTRTIFGFDYVHEQFTPRNKRKFGTYVMPILAGERLVGRVDPKLDRDEGKLLVNSVHAEPGAPHEEEVAHEVGEAIERLASLSGARGVEYTARVPDFWRGALR